MIDLRSDTVTKPSPEMRLAMANAEVGDDVFGEDPSINRLQDMTAELLGFEAALFVPSGTMANQLCIKAHTQAGDEIIMEQSNHPFRAESGGVAALAGVQVNQIQGQRGIITADQIAPQIRSGEDPHHAPTRLVCLENTHNRGGGAIYPIETIRDIRDLTRQHDIPLHLDGARLLNASVAMGVAPTARSRSILTRPRSASPKAWARRWAHCSLAAPRLSGAPTASAKCLAAACARPASLPRRASTRSNTTSSGSPTTIITPNSWPSGSPRPRACASIPSMWKPIFYLLNSISTKRASTPTP